MKIKEAVYKEPCKCCGTHSRDIVSPEVYGCDQCQKEISSPHSRERSYLEVVIFYHDSNAKHFQFCSWECVFKFVKNVQQTENKADYFIELPHLYCDATNDMGKMPTYDDFIQALNKVNYKEEWNVNN